MSHRAMPTGVTSRAVFLDRDNTLIDNDQHITDPAAVKLLPGAALLVAGVRSLGYRVFTVSNQSGVARGFLTEDDVRLVNARLDELLRREAAAATIDAHYFCPFHPEGIVARYRTESPLRKPAPGMLLEAARTHHLDLSRSWMVGDTPRDIEAGYAAGCRTILVTIPGLKPSEAASRKSKAAPDYSVSSLKDVLSIISGP